MLSKLAIGVLSAHALGIKSRDEMDELPQGKGKDHTLWGWGTLLSNQKNEVDEAGESANTAQTAVEDAEQALRDAESRANEEAPEVTKYRKCEQLKNEEINLLYQCTQDAINNYALDHFGGEKRSYPRWKDEYVRCRSSFAKNTQCDSSMAPVNGPVQSIQPVNRYTLVQERMVWQDAKNFCQNIGMELAMTKTEDEQKEAYQTITDYGSKVMAWVGMSRIGVQSDVSFIDGSKDFSEMSPVQHWYYGGQEGRQLRLGQVLGFPFTPDQQYHKWQLYDLDTEHFFICETV